MVGNYYFIISHFNFQGLRLKLIEADMVNSFCTSLSWFRDFKMCVYILNLILNISSLGVSLRNRTQRNILGDSIAQFGKCKKRKLCTTGERRDIRQCSRKKTNNISVQSISSNHWGSHLLENSSCCPYYHIPCSSMVV